MEGGEMADHFPLELRRDATIAVMGLPYTFRMELGRYIANWAGCPRLKFEVILDALPNQLQGAGARDDAAFDILCKTAVSMWEERDKPSCAVINFPIPTNPQLQTLLSLVDRYTTYQGYRPRLLIIECQRRNEFRWRQAVEHPARGIWFNRRYDTGNTEPGKWEDVEKAILNHQQQHLDDYFVTLSQRYPYSAYVKKLVVDPFEDLKARDFTRNKGLDQRSLLAEAIKHYLSCDADEYRRIPVNLDYSLWRRQWLEHRASSRGRGRGATTTTEPHWCRPGDCILRFTNKLLLEEADAICGACEQKITYNNSTEGDGEGAYYYCQFCSLCLHELCALAESPTAITAKNTNPGSDVVSYYAFTLLGDAFKGSTHACHSCKKDGKQFSEKCDACVFRTHLKCQLLPTAFNHSCDQHHFLSIRLSSWDDFENAVYDCKACGLRGAYSSYCCNICNSEYHLECVLDMPLHTKEIAHGGHTHSIDIHFSCGQREYEYKWCCVCYDDINPDTWVYICQDCDFIAHLYCIFPSERLWLYKRISLDDW